MGAGTGFGGAGVGVGAGFGGVVFLGVGVGVGSGAATGTIESVATIGATMGAGSCCRGGVLGVAARAIAPTPNKLPIAI